MDSPENITWMISTPSRVQVFSIYPVKIAQDVPLAFRGTGQFPLGTV